MFYLYITRDKRQLAKNQQLIKTIKSVGIISSTSIYYVEDVPFESIAHIVRGTPTMIVLDNRAKSILVYEGFKKIMEVINAMRKINRNDSNSTNSSNSGNSVKSSLDEEFERAVEEARKKGVPPSFDHLTTVDNNVNVGSNQDVLKAIEDIDSMIRDLSNNHAPN